MSWEEKIYFIAFASKCIELLKGHIVMGKNRRWVEKNIFQCFEISQRNLAFADFAYKTFTFPRKTFAFPRSLEKNSKVLRANAKNLGGTHTFARERISMKV